MLELQFQGKSQGIKPTCSADKARRFSGTKYAQAQEAEYRKAIR